MHCNGWAANQCSEGRGYIQRPLGNVSNRDTIGPLLSIDFLQDIGTEIKVMQPEIELRWSHC